MKNLTMKRVLAGVLGAATMIASSLTMASACTTIYAGANRTQEGTVHRAQRGLRLGHEQALVRERGGRLQRNVPRLPGIRPLYL